MADAADRVRARVADVLKSGLERELTVGGLDLATHSSKVVSEKLDSDPAVGQGSDGLAGWDDSRFEEFAARLSEMRRAITGA